jgi:hypothetical protein
MDEEKVEYPKNIVLELNNKHWGMDDDDDDDGNSNNNNSIS